MSDAADSPPLACPSCGGPGAPDERFCGSCGMPLVHAGVEGAEADVSELHQRARKIRPQYADGDLVRVAGGRHQAEAELIQGILLEEGIPSMLRRTRGFDVPDMLAAGPRDVLVPASGASAAREALLQAELIEPPATAGSDRAEARRVLLGLLAMVALVAVVALIGVELIG